MISKFFDRFTAKSHYFIVKENNLIEVMKLFNTALFAGYYKGGMNVSNLGEHEWFIRVDLTKKQWQALLVECKNKNYQLVIKEEPDKMYFTKVEGSK